MTHQDKQKLWSLFFKNVNFNEYDRFLQLNEKRKKAYGWSCVFLTEKKK